MQTQRMSAPALRLRTLALLGACLPFAATGAFAQDAREVHEKFIAFQQERSAIMENLEYLSDRIGHRLTGSKAMLKANEWTADKMREYGLQNVHLEPYTIPRGWERGKVEAKIVAPIQYTISASQMAWTPGTHGRVKGQVVIFDPRTEAEFEAFRGKLKDAIILRSQPPRNAQSGVLPGAEAPPPIPAFSKKSVQNPNPLSEKTMTGMELEEGHSHGEAQPPNFRQMMEFRQKTNEFLATEGAAAILSVSDKPHELQNMTGSWRSVAKFPTLFITKESDALLHRLLKKNETIMMDLKVDCKFKKGPVTVYNTVGEVVGSEKPDEVVLLGAHLDSWDLAQGTTDNGTGSMVVLEAARMMQALNVRPKRTVRFVLFSGEEQGLYGSRAYVESHKADMAKISVVFVHDTGTGRVRGAWLQGREEVRPALAAEFALLKPLGLMTEEPTLAPNKMNGTDHASFDDAGVPAFAFMQYRAEYSLTHHSQTDTFDKARPEDLMQGACVMAIFAYNAAQRADLYPRK